MNATIHDLEHAKQVVLNNPNVPLSALLAHPHKNWDDAAKRFLSSPTQPETKPVQTAVVVAEPEPIPEAAPVEPVVEPAVAGEPEDESELTDDDLVEIASEHLDLGAEKAAARLMEDVEGVSLDEAQKIVLRALDKKLDEEKAEADKSFKVSADAVAKAQELEAENNRLFLENLAYKQHKKLPVSEAEIQKQARLFKAEQARQKSLAEDWPEPLPLNNVLLPVEPFRIEFLPQAMRAWCLDVSNRMSVPLDFAGIAAIETVAGAVGRRAFVFPKAKDKEWKESIALSGGIVADSGETKTPTWKALLNPLIEQEADWRRLQAEAYGKYEKDLESWAHLQKDAKAKAGKGVDAAASAPEPEPPADYQRLVFNDATPEKIHAAMEKNPSGLLYYRDELASWVNELDKDGRETQRGMFLAAMNGDDPYAMDRIGRGSVHARMCLSVCGNFQPDLIREFLADTRNTADGMVQRFTLLVWPDPVTDKTVMDQPSNEYAKMAFRKIIRTLAAVKPESIWLHFNADAQKMFFQWYNELLDRIRDEGNSGKKSHLSKYKGALPKVAALFQLVDMVGLGGRLEGNFHIDVEHTQMALDFFHYLESHMNRIYESAYGRVERAEVTLVQRIQDGSMPDGMSARDIKRKHWTGVRNLEAIDIELALENLAEVHWVRPVNAPHTGAGRPVIRWQVNPAVVMEAGKQRRRSGRAGR